MARFGVVPGVKVPTAKCISKLTFLTPPLALYIHYHYSHTFSV